MGRFGRAASKPICELITEGGGASPKAVKDCLKWRELILPAIVPRLITSPAQTNYSAPIRIRPGATGEGGFASVGFFSLNERPCPLLLFAQAEKKLRDTAARSNRIYVLK